MTNNELVLDESTALTHANELKNRCLLCMTNEYLDISEHQCKKCPEHTYSTSGSVGSESCLP